jgi:hypothetical protein
MMALDCHIQASVALYSVPYQYVGKRVDVKLGGRTAEIYLDYNLIKTHPRGDKGRRVTDWNDYPPEKAAFFQAYSGLVPAESQRDRSRHQGDHAYVRRLREKIDNHELARGYLKFKLRLT